MAFWGVEVKPGKPFTLKATTDATVIKRLHLSQATLGLGNVQTSRSILQCNVGNKSPLFLCVLSPLKVDSCQLNVEFEEAEDVIFSVIGPLSVHLTGYFLGRSSNAFRLNDDESESFGEDIAGTDGEKGSSDDYDYSDSFINDDDPSVRGSHVSSTDDDELSIKERAAKTKENKRNKKVGKRKMRFQVFDSDSDETSARSDDSANEDSVEILNNDNDHKIPKALSSEVPLPSRVTRSKARSSTLENGETNAKCDKTSEATTDTRKTVDKKEDKKGSEVLSKKKRNKESVVNNIDEGEGENMSESQKPPSDKAIEPSTDVLPSQNGEETPSKKKRKRDRKEETKGRKKQAIGNAENTEEELGTKKLPENSSDEVKIEEIKKGKVDGKVAVQGKKVSILYTAKLKDTGKLIESNLEEAPLKFRLGGDKVIKGLSIGVEGMRVGDKRRLIIPPSLGYSEEGLKKESVPKNAWLVYEVEAVKVR